MLKDMCIYQSLFCDLKEPAEYYQYDEKLFEDYIKELGVHEFFVEDLTYSTSIADKDSFNNIIGKYVSDTILKYIHLDCPDTITWEFKEYYRGNLLVDIEEEALEVFKKYADEEWKTDTYKKAAEVDVLSWLVSEALEKTDFRIDDVLKEALKQKELYKTYEIDFNWFLKIFEGEFDREPDSAEELKDYRFKDGVWQYWIESPGQMKLPLITEANQLLEQFLGTI